MTLSKKDANLLLMLLGIVIFIAAYFLIYNKYVDKTEALETEIQSLESTAETYRGYYANLDSYYAGIETASETVAAERSKYPTAVRSEDMVMYAIRTEDSVGADVTTVDVGGDAVIASFPTVEQNEAGEDETVELTAVQSDMTLTFDLSYEQVKQFITLVNSTAQRTALGTLSLTFNSETGGLSGSAQLHKYAVRSANDPFVATIVPSVPMGTEDLFNTYTVQEEPTETGDAEADAAPAE